MSQNYSAEQRVLMADDLLKNPILLEAFEGLRAAYILAIRRCDSKDDLGRFRYAKALDDIDALEAHLRTAIAHGKLTVRQSQELQTDTIKQKITRIF